MNFPVNIEDQKKISLLKSLQARATRFCTFPSDFIYTMPSALLQIHDFMSSNL